MGSASGVVNVGGFVASLLTILAVGAVLDLLTPGASTDYRLDAFRAAFSVQYVFWAIGLVGRAPAPPAAARAAGPRRRRPGAAARGGRAPGCAAARPTADRAGPAAADPLDDEPPEEGDGHEACVAGGRRRAGRLAGVAVRDLLQREHTLLRNFPVLGHARYLLEAVGPELRQYLVAGNNEERPFTRDQRRWVYASAKKENNYFGFGTDNDLEYTAGYPVINHRTFGRAVPPSHPTPAHDVRAAVREGARRGARPGRRRSGRPRSSTSRR